MATKDLKFSGHDTFHCKEQWLYKGLQLSDSKGFTFLSKPNAIPILGVGRNMLRSIQYWLRAFNLIDENGEITSFAKLVFLEDKFDPYLENDGTLWLLQYYLCSTKYASIFNLIFSDYFSDKVVYEFSEFQIIRFIENIYTAAGTRVVAANTLKNDFNVFIKTYLLPTKKSKTIEDDFNIPLAVLNLISDTGKVNDTGQNIFKVNIDNHKIPIEIIGYCILNEFEEEVSILFDDIKDTIGSYLCLTSEFLDQKLRELSETYTDFVYMDDAGIRQLQIRSNNTIEYKRNLLSNYYGV